LPHLETSEATYFVTFRSNLLLPVTARDVALSEIYGCDGTCLDLVAAVVMPDHVHVIFRAPSGCEDEPRPSVDEGAVSEKINHLFARRGALWMDESFDHIIRNEAELEEKIEYIRQNPIRKGLARQPSDYKWLFVAQESRHTG